MTNTQTAVPAASIESLSPALLPDLWRAAKAAEKAAAEHRGRIELAILNAMAVVKPAEGTVALDDTLSIKFGITRSVDSPALFAAWTGLSENAQKCFRMKADISKKEFDAAHSMAPVVFAEFSAFITSKPVKPAFTLKEQE